MNTRKITTTYWKKNQKLNKLEEILKETENINLKVRYIDKDKNDVNRNLENLSLHLDVLLKNVLVRVLIYF